MRRAVLLIAAAAAALAPVAGSAQPARYLNPRDVAEAQQQNAAVVQEYGGAETGARAAYVQSIGTRVAAETGIANPGQAFHFIALNSAVENAMSVPGGYVYITRQLMTLMDDESQLAFALGHEVGHIAANHAHIRQQYAQRNPLGIFGQILEAVFGQGAGDIVSVRSTLDLLSFSRAQEYQADTLGLHYITAAGYDPEGGPGILAALSRASALEARVQGRTNRQVPEWASTHPLSENRMQRALAEARATGRLGTGMRNRATFLAELEGMYVDDAPAQGIIDGPTFTHPDLKIQFRVPTGYLMQNAADAVSIAGSAGKAEFRTAPVADLNSAIVYALAELTDGRVRFAIPPPQQTVINGMPAALMTVQAPTDAGMLDVSVVAYQWAPGTFYYFVLLTPGGYGIGPFASMVNSLRKISPQEAAAIRPRVIHVVTVGAGDTAQSLSARMAYRDLKLDRFLALNGLNPGSRLAPGQKVKLVVYGQRRS